MTEPPASQFYTGLVADLYGPLRSTSVDALRYRDLVHQYGEPALELGCGDGDPLLDLRAMGLDVDGIDSSADMIERLRRRAAERGLDVEVRVAAMETMQPSRTYRTVFLAGPTFNLLPDDETMARALRAVRRALAPDGTAIIPLFEPEPVVADELGPTRRQQVPGGSISCRIVAADHDAHRRTQTLTLRYERRTSGRADVIERDWLIHWIDLDLFTALATDAGLRVTSAPAAIGPEPADVVLVPSTPS